jgi:hypothetical protein
MSLVPSRSLLTTLLLIRVVWGLVRAWQGLGPKAGFPLWSGVSRVFFGAECVLIAIWLAVPMFSWYLALFRAGGAQSGGLRVERLRRHRLNARRERLNGRGKLRGNAIKQNLLGPGSCFCENDPRWDCLQTRIQ